MNKRGKVVLTLLLLVGVVGIVGASVRPALANNPGGCTPGYWKNHLDAWVGHSPGELFSPHFNGAAPTIRTGRGGKTLVTDPTLLQALNAKGGGDNALARHAVAAMLNNSAGFFLGGLTGADIRQLVFEAYDGGDVEGAKDQLEQVNELGCPLN